MNPGVLRHRLAGAWRRLLSRREISRSRRRRCRTHLHWFKWEAYLTWVTGFGLLIVQYYLHADAFLIDPGVMPLDAVAGDRHLGRIAGRRLVHL